MLTFLTIVAAVLALITVAVLIALIALGVVAIRKRRVADVLIGVGRTPDSRAPRGKIGRRSQAVEDDHHLGMPGPFSADHLYQARLDPIGSITRDAYGVGDIHGPQ